MTMVHSTVYELGLGCCDGPPVVDLSLRPERIIAAAPPAIATEISDTFEPPDTFHRLNLSPELAALHASILEGVAREPRVQWAMDRLLQIPGHKPDRRTWNHCYRVGFLMTAAALAMGMTPQEAAIAGRIGLTHDAGKSDPTVQEAIQNPNRLNPQIGAAIQPHAWYSAVIAQEAGLSGNVQQGNGNHHSLQTDRMGPYGVFRPDSLVAVPESDGKRPDIVTLVGLGAACDRTDSMTAEPALKTRNYQLDGTEIYAYDREHLTKALGNLNISDRVANAVLNLVCPNNTVLAPATSNQHF